MNKILEYASHYSNLGDFVFDHFENIDGFSFPYFSSKTYYTSSVCISPIMTNFNMSGFYVSGYSPSRFENDDFSYENVYSSFDSVTFFYRFNGYKRGYGFYNSSFLYSFLSHVGEYVLVDVPDDPYFGRGLYDSFMHFRSDVEILFSSSDRDVFLKKACEIQCDLGRTLTCFIVHSIINSTSSFTECYYETCADIYFYILPSCCSLDYSPIVRLLGGTPA